MGAIMRGCPIIVLDGYSRPVVTVADYLKHLERCRYRGDRVR